MERLNELSSNPSLDNIKTLVRFYYSTSNVPRRPLKFGLATDPYIFGATPVKYLHALVTFSVQKGCYIMDYGICFASCLQSLTHSPLGAFAVISLMSSLT